MGEEQRETIRSFADIAETYGAAMKVIEPLADEYPDGNVKRVAYDLDLDIIKLPSDEEFTFPTGVPSWSDTPREYSSDPGEYIEKSIAHYAASALKDDIRDDFMRLDDFTALVDAIRQRIDGSRTALVAMLSAVADELDRPQAALMARAIEQQGEQQ